MSKQCINCNSQLDDNAQFCGSCGTAQNCAEVPQEKKKTMKWIIAAGAAVCVAVLVIVLLMSGGSEPKGLMQAENLETELTNAYTELAEAAGYNIDYNVITDFQITDAENDDFDQRFRCNMGALEITGTIKDGMVMNMEMTHVIPEFNTMEAGIQQFMAMLPAFPAAIFEEEIETFYDLLDFIQQMEGIGNYMSAVRGDIKYQFSGTVTKTGECISIFYISYEPADT